MNNVPGVGIEGGHRGPDPRVFVERKKAAEKKSNCIRQEGIQLQREFAINGIRSSNTTIGMAIEMEE